MKTQEIKTNSNLDKTRRGMSLLEILVVVAIVAVLGIITARSVFLTIQGSKKTESLVKVRENLNYALGVIERQIRNADGVAECPNADPNILNYEGKEGDPASFSCVDIGSEDGGYIASGSARLTNDMVDVTTCSFVCAPDLSNNPPAITISVVAEDKSLTGPQAAKVSVQNKIYLRNY